MGKAHIMVVEDEAIVGIDIRECLEDFGYRVTGPIASGEQAVKEALSLKPDLVLMDIMLHGKVDGIVAAQQIKAAIDVPVIYLTAYADDATLARAKVTEPYNYVLKPFRRMELCIVIELALHRHQMEQRRRQLSSTQNGASKPSPTLTDILASLERPNTSAEDQAHIAKFLAETKIFGTAEVDQLSGIAAVCRLESFSAREFLLYEEDERPAPFMVISGRVVLVKSSSSGKDLVVEVVGPRDGFGLVAGFGLTGSPFSAKAQIDSMVLWLPTKIVEYILDRDLEASRGLISDVLQRLRRSYDLSRALAHDRVEVRVASTLLALLPSSVASKSNTLEIELSRQELADMTGTTAETASRVANAMEREGLLDLSQLGKVKVLKPERLNELIAF